MSTSPFASAVEGFFQGREERDRWDERKRQRAREDERWTWAQEDRGWTLSERDRLRSEGKEDREWTQEARKRQRDAWQREEADRKQEAELYKQMWGLDGDAPEAPAAPTAAPRASQPPAPDTPPRQDQSVGIVSTAGPQQPPTPRMPQRDGGSGLRPYDPAVNQPRDVGHGGPSTEYLITENAPEGGVWNIPSIWWNDQGEPVEVPPDQAQQLAMEYEARTGDRFPRFATPDEGAEAARQRSASGGASNAPLASSGQGPIGIMTREPSKPRTPDPWADRTPSNVPASSAPQEPMGRIPRQVPPPQGQRPDVVQPAAMQPPAPGIMPEVQPSTPGRFTEIARAAGADQGMLKMAEEADMAEAALASDVDPRTGRPFEPGAREEVTMFVSNVERRLATVMPKRDSRAPNLSSARNAAAMTGDARHAQNRLAAPDVRPHMPGPDVPPLALDRPPEQPPGIGVMSDYPRIKTGADTPPARPTVSPETDAVAPAQTTAAGTPEESVEVAKEAVVEIGTSGARPTPKQAQKMVKAFGEDYDNRASKKIIRFYLERGEIEKATKFRDFIKNEQVRVARGHWSKAIMAATYGDEKEFVENIAAAYNSDGYYDDGYSIDPKASGFMRDPAGNVVPGKATITFINDQTGERFTREFESEGDLYRLGIDALSVEEVFERGWDEYQAGRSARDKAVPKGTDILKAIEMLGDATINPNAQAFNALSPAEKRAQAVALITGETAGGPAQVPVYGARP